MEKKKEIEPKDYALCFIPAPVYLISTVDEHNVYNIAPYGMVMPVSYYPLVISIGSSKNRDTYRNIKASNEFVLNIPNINLLRKVNRTADPIPSDMDEFIHADLTPINSKTVRPPSIMECCAHMECKTIWIKDISEEAENRVIITANVVALFINENLFLKNLCKQKGLMNPLYYEKLSYFTLGGYVGNRKMR
ncbi:MAG: flavin reductase family protein [Promethearchaeati archaeon]